MISFFAEFGWLLGTLIIGSAVMIVRIAVSAVFEIVHYLNDAFFKLVAWCANRINLRQDLLDRVNYVYANICQRELDEAKSMREFEMRAMKKD